MSADPEPSSTASRYTLASWCAGGVVLALLLAAAAAFVEQRGRFAVTTDVITAIPTEVSVTATESPTTPAPKVTNSTAIPSLAPGTTSTTAPTEPTPVLPPLTLQPDTAGIGETVALSVYALEASSVTVEFLENSYPLGRESDGAWFGVIGVPLGASLGRKELRVVLRDEFGAFLEERSQLVEVAWVDRPVDDLTLTAAQGSILTTEAAAEEYTIRAAQFLSFDRGRRWTGPFRLPVDGIGTTDFGQGRSINGGPVTGQHSGADIANAEGTPVHASAPGRVAWTGEMPIRGNSVLIDHGDGVITGYHHLLEIVVELDEEVTGQTVIAAMGATGLSTGPHLHWELTIYGVNVDPITWTQIDFTP